MSAGPSPALYAPMSVWPGKSLTPASAQALPSNWQPFFDRSRDVVIPSSGDTFRVYESGVAAPGQSLLVLVHGGGHTAMSWALAANIVRKTSPNIAVFAYDCRGHGHSKTADDGDLSLTTMSADLLNLLAAAFPVGLPDLFLVGHSMGGPVVVHAAGQKTLRVQGVCVVDVVEGTALEAVTGIGMLSYLRGRPAMFRSVAEAVSWSLSSGTVRNDESAAVSIPPQLTLRDPDNLLLGYTWRTDLFATQPFWLDWYNDLSNRFLSVRGARLLILAGPDRLDKPLMIGQMQGKFQLKMLPAAGHTVQEDQPGGVAAILIDFVNRNAVLDVAAIRKRTMGA